MLQLPYTDAGDYAATTRNSSPATVTTSPGWS
jgi:hypothetical protein